MSQTASTTTAGGTINFSQTIYDLPDDFETITDRTQWDKTKHWEMLGPEDAQQWQWLKSGYISTGPRVRWRILDGQFQIWPIMNTQEYFRDVHDHLARINSAIDAIRDTIATAIQVNLSLVTIEESEITKRLAAWAAIFAASTALAGIWGMNFETMPELKWQYGYPMALAVICTVAGFLYWRFRRRGWL